jgi:hypothetical protein
MQGKYRDAESLSEIESILKEAEAEESVIWQNINGERLVYNIVTLEYREESRETRFRLEDYKSDFDESQLVYIKLKYRGTMFKAKIIQVNGTYISISNPTCETVKTIELRSEPRTPFDLEEDKLITLTIIRNELAQKDHMLRFQVVDISESGICLLVSNQNKRFMEESFEMYITHLGKIELKKPIPLQRQYIKDFRYKKLGKNVFSNRIGFKLTIKFEPTELTDFLKSKAYE